MNRIGPYIVIDRIASGGMGEIYLAKLQREAGFEKLVAVKRILPHLAHDPGFVRMFEAEARLSALLTHRNIVQVYDFGRSESDTYLAMEFVDGFNLRAIQDMGSESNQLLPMSLALSVAASTARALDYAYRREGADGEMMQIIHRDVSPQNILVSVEGEVKVADFGLAKALQMDATTLSGELKGKLNYMSPEQVRGEPLDTRADIFSLGAVLYELLARQRLYPRGMVVRVLLGVVENADYKPLSTVAPDIPESVQRVVARCLQPRRENRYESAREMANELDQVISGLGLAEPTYKLADHVRLFDAHRPLAKILSKDKTLVGQRPIVSREKSGPSSVSKLAADGEGRTPTAETRAEIPRPGMDASRSLVSKVRTETLRQRTGRPRLPLALVTILLVVVGLVVWLRFVDTGVSEPTPPVGAKSAEPVALGTAPEVLKPPIDAGVSVPLETKLIIEGPPEGAKCFVWDKLRDTKLDSQDCAKEWSVSAGPHTVVVTAETYQDWRKDVEVKAGETLRVQATLQATPLRPCDLRVETTPPGARVLVDGEPAKDSSPVQLTALSAGSHTIEITLAGHRSLVRNVICDRTTPPLLTVAMNPLEITVVIRGAKHTMRPGATWSTATRFGDVRATFRVVARGKGVTVTVNTTPYASIAVGGRPLEPVPLKFRVALGASKRLRFVREGKQVGRLTIKVAEADKGVPR
jgi:serine/threonine protein kinase